MTAKDFLKYREFAKATTEFLSRTLTHMYDVVGKEGIEGVPTQSKGNTDKYDLMISLDYALDDVTEVGNVLDEIRDTVDWEKIL